MRAIAVFSVVFCFAASAAGPLPPAGEAAFSQKRYQQALDAYERAATADPSFPLFYRIQETRALLGRTHTAAAALFAATPPTDPLERGLFHLLRAETGRTILQRFAGEMPEDRGGANPADTEQWNASQWRENISADYTALLPLRDALVAARLVDHPVYLAAEGTDTERLPTFWDLAVENWTEYLLEQSPDDLRPDVLKWTTAGFTPSLAPQTPPALFAASLWEDAANRAGTGRETARELWKLKRAHPPWTAPFDPADAAAWEKHSELLLGLFRSFKQTRAQVAAGETAAAVMNAREDFARAVQTCDLVLGLDPSSECRHLKAEITDPALDVTAFATMGDNPQNVTIKARNLERAYVRLYPTTPKELAQSNGREQDRDWTELRILNREAAKFFLHRKPAFTVEVELHALRPHAFTQSPAVLPRPLPSGLYTVLVSDHRDFGEGTLLRGAVVNVTDLYLFADRPIDEKLGRHRLSLRVIDGKTGEPSPGATIRVRTSAKAARTGRTDARGELSLEAPPGSADPLTEKEGHYAYLPSPIWISHTNPVKRLDLHIDTDRAIYRPGQIVHGRITAMHVDEKGYSLPKVGELELQATHPNGKAFTKRKIRLSSWGTAAFQFKIPEKGLLGACGISVSGKENGTNTLGSGYAQVSVEEYVRPDFEVTLEAPSRAWKLGAPATVTGKAAFYFGGPVAGAPVAVRVIREYFVPFHWYFFRRPNVDSGRETVARGLVRTDAQGAFQFTFTPDSRAHSQELPSRFTVEAVVDGPAGRTLRAERTYLTGPQSFAFELTPEEGFLTAGKAGAMRVRAISLENQPVDVAVRARIETLELPVDAATAERSLTSAEFTALLKNLKVKTRGAGQNFRTPSGTALVPLPALPAGAYRWAVEAKDSSGARVEQSIEFIVFSPELRLPAVALSKTRAPLGGTAEVLAGSSDLRKMVVESWAGESRLSSDWVAGGLQVLRIPIEAKHRGGFTVRWYGVTQGRLRSGETRVEVPWDDRALKLTVAVPPQAKPAEHVRWKVELRDATGKPVSGQALLRVVDRSLDAYQALAEPWVASLYGPTSGTPPFNASYFPVSFSWFGDGPKETAGGPPREPKTPPQLRSRALQSGPRLYGMMGGSASLRKAVMATGLSAEAPGAAAPSNVRRSFQETAFFGPEIALPQGRAQVAFAFSDATTSWNVQGYALDADYRWGAVSTTLTTQQDFFVQTRTPRFLREGDSASLQTLVTNTTDRALKAKVSLTVSFDAEKSHTLKVAPQTVRVEPHSTHTLQWPLDVPLGSGTGNVMVVAEAGALRDSQKKEFLWLPARQRQIDSRVATVEAKKVTRLETTQLPPGAQVEAAVLQIDPQTATAIVRALPSLVSNTREDSLSVVDRYVPAAIVFHLFQSVPELAGALAHRPGRKNAIDIDDPRRLTDVEQSPWRLADDETSTALPTTAELEKLAAVTWKKLESLQRSDGAFPLFAQGPDDAYLTLYVLAQLAEAKRNGVRVPSTIAQKALPYLKARLGAWVDAKPVPLSFALYTAYVLTATYEPAQWRGTVDKLVGIATENADALTPIGKAYLSEIAYARGEREAGEKWLEAAMDGMREGPLGAYWTPEKQSWVWYSDTLDKHALFLRLLLDRKPGDPRVPALVRWMLFNRKATQWACARNSASAVLALVQYQKRHKALLAPETFRWQWNGRDTDVRLTGREVLEGALTWRASPVDRKTAKATIEKTGPAIAFASLSTVFWSKEARTSSSGPVGLEARFFSRTPEGTGFRLTPLTPGASVKVGTEIEAALAIRADVPVEYLHVKLPRAAGFEGSRLTSGWEASSAAATYHEVRDTRDDYFLPRVAAGETVLRTRFFATTPGHYRFGPVLLQSLYSPDLTANAGTFDLKVVQ